MIYVKRKSSKPLSSFRRHGEAAILFRKAAEQGYATAKFNLGLVYSNGLGVGKDDSQAVLWFRKAADQGNSGGQTNLGVMYEDGRGVARDLAQALIWYDKAADQGDAVAQGVAAAFASKDPRFAEGGLFLSACGIAVDEKLFKSSEQAQIPAVAFVHDARRHFGWK
jgi:TPR repeat protein